MKLQFKEITIRNFLSFGNNYQTIKLDDEPYQVIVGRNYDKSDSNTDTNGCGKTSVAESINYALFGKSIGNKITLGNLMNITNKKNLEVKLKFMKGDVEYIIERGRSPNYLRFYKNGEEIIDESQGDSRNTQEEIEKVIGMNEDVFNQIILLTCKIPMFYDQSTANQKQILEKILGVDVISEKIDNLKALIKDTKNNLNNETFKYDTIKNQNETLKSSIATQEEQMKIAKDKWKQEIENNIDSTQSMIDEMNKIDIDKEIQGIKDWEEYNKKYTENFNKQQQKMNLMNEIQSYKNTKELLETKLNQYNLIDFAKERENISFNDSLKVEEMKYNIEIFEHNKNKQQYDKLLKQFDELGSSIKLKDATLKNTKPDICPTCGNVMDEKHYKEWKNSIQKDIDELRANQHKVDLEMMEVYSLVNSFKTKEFNYKETKYKDMNTLNNDEKEKYSLSSQLSICNDKIDNCEKQLSEIIIDDLQIPNQTHYKTMEEVMQYKSSLDVLHNKLKTFKESLNTNPFEQQEKSIEEMKTHIVDPSDEEIVKLNDDLLHQDTLLKLLNSPSSFIRKTILDKSLEFLNAKITQYLISLGSLHTVSFNNDMSLSFYQMGVEYGYASSGEMGRISMAIMLAFRDVWETLNNCSVNLMMIDEVIDRIGLDISGVEMLVNTLKSKNDKNVKLISHNESVINQASSLMIVAKENGFSEIKYDEKKKFTIDN